MSHLSEYVSVTRNIKYVLSGSNMPEIPGTSGACLLHDDPSQFVLKWSGDTNAWFTIQQLECDKVP